MQRRQSSAGWGATERPADRRVATEPSALGSLLFLLIVGFLLMAPLLRLGIGWPWLLLAYPFVALLQWAFTRERSLIGRGIRFVDTLVSPPAGRR